MKEINLDPKQIVEKQFKQAVRGYNGKEVDTFLDEVIQDYEAYAANIAELQAENKRLADEIETLKNSQPQPIVNNDAPSALPKQAPMEQDSSMPGTTNYDILKRLSNLERHVFGQSGVHDSFEDPNIHQSPVINSTDQLYQSRD